MRSTRRCSRGHGGSMCRRRNLPLRPLPPPERAMLCVTPARPSPFATPTASSSSPGICPLRLLYTLTRVSANCLCAIGEVTGCVVQLDRAFGGTDPCVFCNCGHHGRVNVAAQGANRNSSALCHAFQNTRITRGTRKICLRCIDRVLSAIEISPTGGHVFLLTAAMSDSRCVFFRGCMTLIACTRDRTGHQLRASTA